MNFREIFYISNLLSLFRVVLILPIYYFLKLMRGVAAKAIEEDNISENRLDEYACDWHKAQGKNHERTYKIKQAVYKLTDEDLNKTADTILSLSSEKRTLTNIFRTALFRHPSLILDVIKVFMKK